MTITPPQPSSHSAELWDDHYAVIGHPVAHSLSPFIHSQFAKQTGQALQYQALLSPLDGFERTLQAFARAGGRGCNVTVPFKQAAFDWADQRSARADLAGAANVLTYTGTAWQADNTDGAGLVQDIERHAGVRLARQRVLLIGAGGAAAGALGPLLQAGPAQLVLTNRSLDKAQALLDRHQALSAAHQCALSVAPLADCGQHFDVVINASTSSLQGQAAPVGEVVLKQGGLALDMMYGAHAQAFIHWASAHGAQARDGLGMLVEQAALAFAMWRGVYPDTAPVLAQLRGKMAPTNEA